MFLDQQSKPKAIAQVDVALNHQEEQVLRQLMRIKSGNQSWYTIGNILQGRCGRCLPHIEIRFAWWDLTLQMELKRKQIAQFFRLLVGQGWYLYRKVSQIIAQNNPQSLFGNLKFAKGFLAANYIKTMTQLERTVQTLLNRLVVTIPLNQKRRIAQFFVKCSDNFRQLPQAEILRYFLNYIYLCKFNKLSIKKDTILSIYSYMVDYREEFMCEQITTLNSVKRSFSWTDDEMIDLFNMYKQKGSDYPEMSKIFILKYGQKEKYCSRNIYAALMKFQKQAFFDLKDQILKHNKENEVEFHFRVILRNAKYLLLKVSDPNHPKTVDLLSIVYGRSFSFQELKELHIFLRKLLKHKQVFRFDRSVNIM